MRPLQVALKPGPTLRLIFRVPSLTQTLDFPKTVAFYAYRCPNPSSAQAQAQPPGRWLSDIPNPLPSLVDRRNYDKGNSAPPTLSMRPHMLKIMPSRFM